MTRFLEKSFISGTIYRKLQQCMGQEPYTASCSNVWGKAVICILDCEPVGMDRRLYRFVRTDFGIRPIV